MFLVPVGLSKEAAARLTGLPLFIAALIVVLAVNSESLHAQRRISWAPDGQRFVINAEYGDSSGSGIYVVNVEGLTSWRLFASGRWDSYPSWSPDGQRIVFASDSGGHSDIYVVDVESKRVRQLTKNQGKHSYPSWAPDGRRIAFNSNRNGRWQIYLMGADGSNARQVTHTQSAEWNPEWSPDGRKLVFESGRNGGGKDDIYVVDDDGTNERRLTDVSANAVFPSWSLDGTRIAFCEVANREASLWTVSAGGTGLTRLTDVGCLSRLSPSGDRLAFFRSKGDSSGVYVLTFRSLVLRRVMK